jgi:hypothetical protein
MGQTEERVGFVCQECRASISFPLARCGHVETCPDCGANIDVPCLPADAHRADGGNETPSVYLIPSEPDPDDCLGHALHNMICSI